MPQKKSSSLLFEQEPGAPVKNGRDTDAEAYTMLLEEFSPKPGMKVLDIRSGLGNTVLAIAEKAKPRGRNVGVDLSENAITKPQGKARREGLDGVTEFRLGDAENLPFEDETFDAVISECIVCLVPDKQKALNEKAGVLKPGGRVIMHDVISLFTMPEALRSDPALYCGCIGGATSIEEYERMMERAGLGEIRVVDFTKQAQKSIMRVISSAAANLEGGGQPRQVLEFVYKGGL